MPNIQKLWNALFEFDSEWRKEDNMPLNELENIFQKENEGQLSRQVCCLISSENRASTVHILVKMLPKSITKEQDSYE